MNRYHQTFQGFLYFRKYKRTWSFPREVERLLMDECSDGTVLHLYGGLARFGDRLDMDVRTSPDVLGNALYPPFKCDSYDYVVLDPPYASLKGGVAMNIVLPAACIARRRVFWVHTHWPLRDGLGLRLNRWWLGSPCSMGAPVRVIAEYLRVRHPNTCVGWPRRGRRKMNGMLGKYDWSHHVPTPRRKEGPVWQGKLL